MLHNKSTLILAGLAAALYLLYTRLTKEEKQEVVNDMTSTAQQLIDKKLTTT
jgi:hypothetical protein